MTKLAPDGNPAENLRKERDLFRSLVVEMLSNDIEDMMEPYDFGWSAFDDWKEKAQEAVNKSVKIT